MIVEVSDSVSVEPMLDWFEEDDCGGDLYLVVVCGGPERSFASMDEALRFAVLIAMWVDLYEFFDQVDWQGAVI